MKSIRCLSTKRLIGLLVLVMSLFSLLLTGCDGAAVASSGSRAEPADTEGGAPVGLPNPASVYCEEQGGTLDFRYDEDGNQYGICVFEDGSQCEEWAFFRGECAPDID